MDVKFVIRKYFRAQSTHLHKQENSQDCIRNNKRVQGIIRTIKNIHPVVTRVKLLIRLIVRIRSDLRHLLYNLSYNS
jgi:hypothetical protein